MKIRIAKKKLGSIKVPEHLRQAKLQQPTRTAISLWPALAEKLIGEPHIAKPGGNARSPVLLLTPTPTVDEYRTGVFTSEPAVAFTELLADTIGLHVSDLFVAPCCRVGLKALKGNTAEIMQWSQMCLQRGLFKFIISVGDDATMWIVNGGNKANMQMMAGHLLYPPKLFHLPLFIFPQITGLIPENKPGMTEKDQYFARKAAENQHRRFAGMMADLKIHIQKLILDKRSPLR